MYESVKRAYFPDASIALDDGSEASIRILESKKHKFARGATYKIAVLLLLKRREINFMNAADAVIAYVQKQSEGSPVAIEAYWIIVGNRAGIYLFDALAIEENLRYRGMLNTICTIDAEDGKTFFKPGTIQNEAVSRRIEELIADEDMEPMETVAREFVKALEVLMAMLEEMNRFKRAKRIEI
jgi:hypothetical protein